PAQVLAAALELDVLARLAVAIGGHLNLHAAGVAAEPVSLLRRVHLLGGGAGLGHPGRHGIGEVLHGSPPDECGRTLSFHRANGIPAPSSPGSVSGLARGTALAG